jgi:hypothetical protein
MDSPALLLAQQQEPSVALFSVTLVVVQVQVLLLAVS